MAGGSQADSEAGRERSLMPASFKLRKQVYERDRGFCVECSADCEMIRRVFSYLISFEAQTLYADVLRMSHESRVFWDVDHIIELADNGPDELDNLQTLCVDCHRTKTAKNHARRGYGARRRNLSPRTRKQI